ncbi:hypothetical protein FKM82_006372 [Ascaphus truei]
MSLGCKTQQIPVQKNFTQFIRDLIVFCGIDFLDYYGSVVCTIIVFLNFYKKPPFSFSICYTIQTICFVGYSSRRTLKSYFVQIDVFILKRGMHS